MKENRATFIGLCFTVVSFLLTWTYIVPILAITPAGILLEGSFIEIFGKEPFDTIGLATLLTLLVLVASSTFIYYKYIIKKRNKGESFDSAIFIAFLSFQVFLIHPLGFYLSLSGNWSKAGDGQMFLGTVKTFPISSFVFVIFGFLADKVIKRKKATANTVFYGKSNKNRII